MRNHALTASWLVTPPSESTRRMFFVVAMKPRVKGRPRFSRAGHAYTPKETRQFEAELKHELHHAMKASGWVMTKEPVCVHANFVFKKPKSGTRDWPRGDLDNFLKALLDSAQGIVFPDDDYVVSAYASKEYGIRDQIEFSVCTSQNDY